MTPAFGRRRVWVGVRADRSECVERPTADHARKWAVLPTQTPTGFPSVEGMDLPVLAGATSTMIFVVATLPMLGKAARSKDLGSYSLGNIALANAGNLVYSIYVVSLPVGPIWVLHGFYLASTGLMLFWYIRYRSRDAGADSARCSRQAGGAAAAVRTTHPSADAAG